MSIPSYGAQLYFETFFKLYLTFLFLNFVLEAKVAASALR